MNTVFSSPAVCRACCRDERARRVEVREVQNVRLVVCAIFVSSGLKSVSALLLIASTAVMVPPERLEVGPERRGQRPRRTGSRRGSWRRSCAQLRVRRSRPRRRPGSCRCARCAGRTAGASPRPSAPGSCSTARSAGCPCRRGSCRPRRARRSSSSFRSRPTICGSAASVVPPCCPPSAEQPSSSFRKLDVVSDDLAVRRRRASRPGSRCRASTPRTGCPVAERAVSPLIASSVPILIGAPHATVTQPELAALQSTAVRRRPSLRCATGAAVVVVRTRARDERESAARQRAP